MTTNRTDIPSPNAPNYHQRVRETLMTYLGKQGNILDRGLTLRDLVESGMFKLPPGWRPGGGSVPLLPGPGFGTGDLTDLTPPPTPTGFSVGAAFTNIFISHDPPVFLMGAGYKQTRVYGVTVQAGDPLPTFNDAIEITQFSGEFHAHPSNPATTWRLWIKWETNAGVLSVSPAGGTNGLEAVTGQDVNLLIETLQGQITESELYQALGERIDLIDGPPELAGSVAARIQAEANARIQALLDEAVARNAQVVAESQARVTAIQNEAQTRAQAILDEAQARVNGDGSLQQQIDLLSAASSGDFQDLIAAVEEEATARINGDAAEAQARQDLAAQVRGTYPGTDISQVTTGLMFSERQARTTADAAETLARETLASQIRGNYTGSDLEQVTSGLLFSERQARVSQGNALAQDISTLATTVTNGLGSLSSQIDNEETARINGDAAEALARQNLAVQMRGSYTGDDLSQVTTGLMYAERQARIMQDGVLAGQVSSLSASVDNAIGTVTALIQDEEQARISADEAEALARQNLAAQMRGNYAGSDIDQVTTGLLHAERQARAAGDSALATDLLALGASVNSQISDVEALITAESQTRANELEAVATQISAVTATAQSKNRTYYSNTAPSSAGLVVGDIWYKTNDKNKPHRWSGSQWVEISDGRIADTEAAIYNESQARASAVSALASDISQVSAQATKTRTYRQNNAPTSGMIAGDLWFDADDSNKPYRYSGTQWVLTEDTRISATQALMQDESVARAEADSALATRITQVQASSGEAPGVARRLFWDFSDGLQGWTATNATVSVSNGVVTWAPTATNPTFNESFPTSDRYIGAEAPVVRARVRRVSGSGSWEGSCYHYTAAHTASNSYVKRIGAPENPDVWNELEWDMSDLTAGGNDYVANEIRGIRIDLVSDANTSVWEFDWIAIGSRSVTPQDAAIRAEATVRANQTGELYAQYTVKVDVNGYVSGYGLASKSNNAIPDSEFAVRADRFYIASPTGPGIAPTIPFIVQTTPVTNNGVPVPVGAYLTDAYIRNGSIINAKIADLAVDDAKIANLSASKIRAGSIAVGQYIQSSNYVSNTQGWRINGNGNAEFSNAVVRGVVYATDGTFLGTVRAGTTLLGGVASSYTGGTGLYAGGTTSSNYRFRVGNPSGARIQWNGSAIQIYNNNNQLVMSSGSISASFVSGLGSFAFLNSITASNASTYISNAAIDTAQIANAAISSAKLVDAAVTNAKIANLAVTSAKIADLAVTNAKIGNASVNRLKIAGESATFIRSVSSAFNATNQSVVRTLYPLNDGETNVVSWSAKARVTGWGQYPAIVYIRIWKNGSIIVDNLPFYWEGHGAHPGYYINEQGFFTDSGASTYQITFETQGQLLTWRVEVELICLGSFR